MDVESRLRREIQELKDELDALKTTLEVVGTIDLDSGMLNRTGVLDALERAKHWLTRRGDIYGLIVITFPDLADEMRTGPDAGEFRTHVAATMGAAIREVDAVGTIDDRTFAAVLADLNAGAIWIVAARMQGLLERLVTTTSGIGGTYRISGVEVLSATASGEVLQRTVHLTEEPDDGPVIGQIE
jgi:GGDEF domain-containing protein